MMIFLGGLGLGALLASALWTLLWTGRYRTRLGRCEEKIRAQEDLLKQRSRTDTGILSEINGLKSAWEREAGRRGQPSTPGDDAMRADLRSCRDEVSRLGDEIGELKRRTLALQQAIDRRPEPAENRSLAVGRKTDRPEEAEPRPADFRRNAVESGAGRQGDRSAPEWTEAAGRPSREERTATIPASLFRYLEAKDLKQIGDKIGRGATGELTDAEVEKMLLLYGRLYQTADSAIAEMIEPILKDIGVEFRHALAGFHQMQAEGFEKVRLSEIFKLSDRERAILMGRRIESGGAKRETILFELCPRVVFRNKIIFDGKVIVQ